MPASWRICLNEPRAPELAIMNTGFGWSRLRLHRLADLVGGGRPLLDHGLLALLLRDEARVVLVVDLRRPGSRSAARISSFSGGITTSFFEIVMPA